MTTDSIIINTSQQSYPIYIAEDLLSNAELLQQSVLGKQVFILTDANVAPYYLSRLESIFAALQCESLVLSAGEQHKVLSSAEKIYTRLVQGNFHRNMTMFALGGGVIGDLAGFVAATYQRGVSVVQIPTSLLAQLDASIGGKTAVNHPLAKNMIGVFHQPHAVFISLNTLLSLDQRQYCAGFAEMIKHALIADGNYFNWIEAHIVRLLNRDLDVLHYAVKRSCEIKGEIIEQDEKDRGQRQVLNFGHTLAHALEAASHYQLLHGEAVAAGILYALELSEQQFDLSEKLRLRVIALFEKLALLDKVNQFSGENLASFMLRDKKNEDDKIKFILLKDIGVPYLKCYDKT